MKKLVFEKDSPTGYVMIDLRKEFNILYNGYYCCNRSYKNLEQYENDIIDAENTDYDLMVIVNDNSKHNFAKRCSIKGYKIDDLKCNI